MILGRVTEQIVASVKHPTLEGRQLFWVEPLEGHGAAFIAINAVGAGPGDTVVVCGEGTGCRQILLESRALPVNHVIAGVVDEVSTTSSTFQTV